MLPGMVRARHPADVVSRTTLRLAAVIPVPLLRRNWSRFNTPLPAILVQALVVGVLMNFGFNVLVTINVRAGERELGPDMLPRARGAMQESSPEH